MTSRDMLHLAVAGQYPEERSASVWPAPDAAALRPSGRLSPPPLPDRDSLLDLPCVGRTPGPPRSAAQGEGWSLKKSLRRRPAAIVRTSAGERKADAEPGSAMGGGLGADGATLALDDGPRDREPQPEAGGVALPRRAAPVEAIEEPRQLVGRQPGAIVGDHDQGLRPPRRGTPLDPAAPLRHL